ncbi:MAG: hypothetical protein H6729_06455 [Deltaproteobacteria bacterium]|nr:hypothetical protein [Deltaproteobacteria bacterium]
MGLIGGRNILMAAIGAAAGALVGKAYQISTAPVAPASYAGFEGRMTP